MQKSVAAAAIAAALIAPCAAAFAGPQVLFVTPAGAPLLPKVIYEIDYAVAGASQNADGVSQVDTIVSLGLPSTLLATKCNLQVAWYDWNGALVGTSGALFVNSGQTLEFTTSINRAVPTEYVPFTENVFSNIAAAFEGQGQVRTDTSCAAGTKFRVDAEFAIHTKPAAGDSGTVAYKAINVTAPKGLTGY